MSMECKALTVNSENPNNPIPTEGFYVVMKDPNDNGMIRHYIIDFEFMHAKSKTVEDATFSIRTDDIDALNDLFAKYVDEQQLCDVDIKNIRIINSAANFHNLSDFERDEE